MRILAAFLGATFACGLSPSVRGQQAATGVGGEATADGADANATARVSSGDEPRPQSGFQHALRVGMSLPAGVSSEGRSLGDDVVRRVPVMADIGYRLNPSWYIGLMGMIGADMSEDECGLAGGATRARCTVEGWRLGAEVFAHPLGRSAFDLWLGGGIGWEHFEQKAVLPPAADAESSFGTTLRSSEEGPALDLAAGVDFPVYGKLAAGPFIGYTGGVFLKRLVECPPTSSCPANEIDETGLHHWLTLGARGTFGP